MQADWANLPDRPVRFELVVVARKLISLPEKSGSRASNDDSCGGDITKPEYVQVDAAPDAADVAFHWHQGTETK